MRTFLLVISSPEGDILRREVGAIYLRGSEGELAVMAGHTPFVTTVKPCYCKIETRDGTILNCRTEGGILTVSRDKVTFLSGSFSFGSKG